MMPSDLKESVKAGLARSYFDGVRKWSRKGVEGIINPSGYRNSIDDPEIVKMFKEIEQEGIIKIIGNDDVYLEILTDKLTTSKVQTTKNFYAKLIEKHFGVSQEKSKELATKLYDQIVAHGGNPHNIKEIEPTIQIIVGKWLA